MKAAKVGGDLTTPGGAGWSEVAAERVELQPSPLDAQPTEYIRAKWADLPYGTVGGVDVAAASDGQALYVRLEWDDSDTPNTEFPDAAAVYFPGDGAAAANTFGSTDHPVDLWYWQANLDAGRHLVGQGPGAFTPGDGSDVSASAALDGGRWAVVLSAPLGAQSPASIGVAVWDGSNEERAGLGAVTPEWVALELPPGLEGK